MHRKLKEVIPALKGVSENIVAVNLDIREVFRFRSGLDSEGMAAYLRKIYLELINGYFANVPFIKTTNNGLLFVIPFTLENEKTVICETLDVCLDFLKNFGKISKDAAGVDNGAPQNIGIGLSRGSACRLITDNQTLDYYGEVLNMTSKLADIAYPGGIIFNDAYDDGILSDEQRELFRKKTVFINGIADGMAIDICYMKYFTEISPVWKQPIPVNTWRVETDVITLRNLMIVASSRNWVSYPLSSKPCKFDGTSIIVEYPVLTDGFKSTRLMDFRGFNHSAQADKTFVRINYALLAKKLLEKGVEDGWEVIINIKYQEQ